jgi:plasmid maintenance system antidote protein VapI
MNKDRAKPRTKTEILAGWRDIRCGAIIANTEGLFKKSDPPKPDYANDVMRGDMSDAEFAAKLREWKSIPCPARLIIVAVKKRKTASGETETEITLRPLENTLAAETIADELRARAWTVDELAKRMNVSVEVATALTCGALAVTQETAQGLSSALGTSALFWLNLSGRSAGTDMNVTIVLARTETTQKIVKHGRIDLGKPNTLEDVQVPVAVSWLQCGSTADIQAAQKYAADNGYQVFTYLTSEPDPLGRARKHVMNKASAAGSDK